MKQTAVEFLESQYRFLELTKTDFEQAKEIEKEQKGYSEKQVKQAITNFYMNDLLLTEENLTKVINDLKQQEQIKTAKELIGKHVTAIGLYGVWKGKEVFGILSEDKGDWIINIIDEDGFEMPCSVFSPTIKES
jgi:hypothetical protein